MDTPAEVDAERLRVLSITSSGRRAVLLTSDAVSVEAEHLPARGLPGRWEPGPAAGLPARSGGSEQPPEQAGPDRTAELAPSGGCGGAAGAGRLGIVVAHGFTGALDRPAVRRAALHLSRHGGVVTFSFRGHGNSGGRSTVGDREVLDLDAAVRWARSLGYDRVATVGFSMGGSVVLRHAGDRRGGREAVDAVVAVSSPARWYYRGTAPMRRVHWAITRPAGRLVSQFALRTRIGAEDWDPVPLSPVESVPHVAPTPLLIVHGDRDGYFPLDHPYSLAAAGEGNADLWIEPGFGHAENAAGPALLSRIGGWLTERTAGFPVCDGDGS